MFAVVLLLLLALSRCETATAADTSRISCTLYTQLGSQSLFFNSGNYSTNGPAIWAVPECADKETGIYGNLFLIAPLRDWDIGKEVDVRVGRRFKAGELDINASLAYYTFGVGPGHLYNTADGRLRVSRTFEVASISTLQPYGYVDVQHSLDKHANSLAVAGGVVSKTMLNRIPGRPYLTVDIGAWKYLETWSPHTGPIWSVSASLAYDINKNLTIGPNVMHTRGTTTNSDRDKNMVGVWALYKF